MLRTIAGSTREPLAQGKLLIELVSYASTHFAIERRD
jgi:hypothetical protein